MTQIGIRSDRPDREDREGRSYFSYLAIRRRIPHNSFIHSKSEEVGLESIPFDASSFVDVDVTGLLRVGGLSVSYAALDHPPVMVLRQLDLEIVAGEVVGILGESGSGKSTLARSILRLLPADALVNGSILFRDQELLGLSEKQLRRIRGARISLIHQEPGLALSPVMRVGDQIAQVILAHRTLTRKARKLEVESILREVQLVEAERICAAYPHQLSGGELHRVAIAQALACRPDLIIADEPTRSLDVTVQAEVLGVLRNLNQTFGTAILFITHNPALLAGFANRVAVMYAGRVVEIGSASRVFGRPLHPYTRGLLDLMPRSVRAEYSAAACRLPTIPDGPPDLKRLNPGCAFEPRCSRRIEICRIENPEELTPESGHCVSCFNHGS
jgi:oligopeptide/dipeptide ABC transporter ATP-binding protein